MKKRLLFTIFILVLQGMVLAQENTNNKPKFGFSISSGMAFMPNSGCVSLFQDPISNYTTPILAVDFGAGFEDGGFIGLELGVNHVYTSAHLVNEEMTLANIAVLIRPFVPMNNNLGVNFGAKLGAVVKDNSIVYLNGQSERTIKEYYRWGMNLELEFGMGYRFSRGVQVGISIAPFIDVFFRNTNVVLPNDIPEGVTPNNSWLLSDGIWDDFSWSTWNETITGIKLMFRIGSH